MNDLIYTPDKHSNTWEVCPLCKGNGSIKDTNVNYNSTSSTYINEVVCSVCNGKKIISTLTGMPPNIPNKIS